MSRCKICNVDILDKTDKCPFCKCVLDKSAMEQTPMYPDVRGVTRKYRFLENLFLFLSLLAAVITVGINYAVRSEIMWSLIVVLVLFYANVVLRLAIIGKSGYMFKIVSLIITGIAVMFGIDNVIGYRAWSMNYVMPSGILLMDFGILLLMVINHRNWQSYLMAQILTILLSLIPIILFAVGIITFPILAFIAFGVSLFIFLGTVILGDRRARTELQRRFHI